MSNRNVFAALETLKKKKKEKEAETQVFWAPAALTAKSWADVDDDDDDDYYATTVPPHSVWDPKETVVPLDELQESESDDEGDDDVEEELEPETEPEHKVPVPDEQVVQKPSLPPLVPKETERQLSKKELKKKGLAELEAVLVELGISGNDNQNSGQDETKDRSESTSKSTFKTLVLPTTIVRHVGITEEKKSEEHNGIPSGPGPSECKGSKKKTTKKEKPLKAESKDHQEPSNGSAADDPDEVVGDEVAEGDTSFVDVKERLKKVASMKKKKSGKEMDAAAKAAAIEAAARSAKLAASKKKKEKNHYNQQPVR